MTGVIKRLVNEKGFGFIRGDGTETEYFFHRSACARGVQFETLRVGEHVEFVDVEGDKGPRAEAIERKA